MKIDNLQGRFGPINILHLKHQSTKILHNFTIIACNCACTNRAIILVKNLHVGNCFINHHHLK